MGLNRSSSDLLSRRDLLAAGALTVGSAVGLALLPRNEPAKNGKPADRRLITDLPLDRRLAMNAEEMEKLRMMGAQRYMADLRRRAHRLLAESNPLEEKAECVDERQEDGITNCVAGLGVHLSHKQRQAIAANIITDALAKYQVQRQRGRDVPITIRLTWHGEGKCGAALLACKQQRPNVKHFTEMEIDTMARNGALLLAEEIQTQLRAQNMTHACRVRVEQVPPNQFVGADGHPGGVILINGDPELEHNRDGEPLLPYGTSYNVFGGQGIRDAVLSARISMGNHGFHHVYDRHHQAELAAHAPRELREEDKPIYVAAGPAHVTHAIRRDLLREIGTLDEADQHRVSGRIDTWVTTG